MAKKKKFAVYPRTKKVTYEGLKTGKGHREFNYNHSLMNISDPAEAAEINDKYGAKGSQDVYVVEDEKYAHARNGETWDVKGADVKTTHHYTFGTSSAFAQAWEEFEKRRKEKSKEKRSRRRKGAEVIDYGTKETKKEKGVLNGTNP